MAEGTQLPGGDGPDLSSVCAQDNPNDRRRPDASFTCVTGRRKFGQLCKGDDGDGWNCRRLKTKCWACRRNAQEISMTPARTVRRSSAMSIRFLDMTVSSDVRDVTRAMIALAVERRLPLLEEEAVGSGGGGHGSIPRPPPGPGRS